ncbi:MAG: cytochrome b/b6 domain-containing protein [Syntrophobacteraceae bacterium]
MDMISWGSDPWGRQVPLHIAFWLLWAALFCGLVFMVVHALWLRLRPKSTEEPRDLPATAFPEKVPRHSLPARIFHWVMAASVLVLLFSAFLPRAGVRFAWVGLHWEAGIVLVFALLFHLVHSLFFLDSRSIWPEKSELMRIFSRSGPVRERAGKYPLANKLYHLAATLCGVCAAATGVLMMSRVHTPFFTRNPYLFSDMTWGVIYLLHGFSGVALIALVMVHVYFALRPEKLPLTKAMISGALSRGYYLEHHDPERWGVEQKRSI